MTAAGNPFLTVAVCPTDGALLRNGLESLCRQTLAPDAFEVIVVDLAAADAARAVVEPFAGRLPLRYVSLAGGGRAEGWNRAVSLARGEVVLFLDDGDVADPEFLEAHAAAHRRLPAPEIGILGHTRLAAELELDPLMRFVAAVGGLPFAAPGLEPGATLDFSYFRGGRASAKRSAILEQGGFDPRFEACEDVELGYRLSRRGFRVVYEPRAVSTYARRESFDGFLEQVEREGRARLLLSRLHPDDAVARWCEVREAHEAWRRLGPLHAVLLRSGRELDRIARMRVEAGDGLGPTDAALLCQGYWAAFRASRFKGIVERAAELGARGGVAAS